jgi:thiol-disulfide isomerase/thioredoxin
MTRRLVLLTAAVLAAASTAGCGAGGKTGAAPSPTTTAPSASASGPVSGSVSPKVKAVPALPADLGYVDYAAYAAHRRAFDNRKVVLFYWTSWCPSSAAYQEAFQTAVRAHTLPRNLSIVQVDYDDNDVQPVGYDVTQFDLFVLVDRNGKALREPLANPAYGQVLKLAA